MGKADRMVLLGLMAPLGLVLPLDLVYNLFLALVLVGVLVTLVLRLRATFHDLQPAG